MKCSKCGGEIKNLPEYIAETGAEVLCTQCAGYSEQSENSVIMPDRFRTMRTLVHSGEMDAAA